MKRKITFFLCSINFMFSQECLGGELRTYESYTYGRFEVNMKSAEGNGYISSFFTYHDFWETPYGSWQTYINEIDIELTGNLDNSVQFTTHHPGPWSLTQIIGVDFNPHQEYHDYAFEWTPTYVKWFIDDIEVYSQEEDVVNDLVYPHKIMMNIWSAIWEDWVGQWNPNSMPVSAYYDYARYYEYNEDNGNYGTNNDFTLIWEENFDSYNPSRWVEATHGFDGNNCQFDPLNVVFHNGEMILLVSSINYILGDVNNDQILNIVDIVSIVNIILLFEDVVNVADFNQDNYINVVDLIEIINMILSD